MRKSATLMDEQDQFHKNQFMSPTISHPSASSQLNKNSSAHLQQGGWVRGNQPRPLSHKTWTYYDL